MLTFLVSDVPASRWGAHRRVSAGLPTPGGLYRVRRGPGSPPGVGKPADTRRWAPNLDAGTSETRNVSTPPLDIKVDEALHNLLKNIADRNNRSLQWLTRQALVSYLEAIIITIIIFLRQSFTLLNATMPS